MYMFALHNKFAHEENLDSAKGSRSSFVIYVQCTLIYIFVGSKVTVNVQDDH